MRWPLTSLLQVFGKTIICPNLEIAGAYVRSHSLNAITLDGDKVERKGSLHGGYHDPKRSRLDAVRDVKKWADAHAASSAALAEIKAAIDSVEQEVASIEGSLQKLKSRSTRAAATRDGLINDMAALRDEEGEARRRIEVLLDAETRVERDLASALSAVAAMEQELQTPLTAGLSNEEVAELEELNARVDAQQAVVADLSERLGQVSSSRGFGGCSH